MPLLSALLIASSLSHLSQLFVEFLDLPLILNIRVFQLAHLELVIRKLGLSLLSNLERHVLNLGSYLFSLFG